MATNFWALTKPGQAEFMSSYKDSNGWIFVEIPPKFELQARELRAERDLQYGNIFTEQSTDERWVGDLGEIAFKSWLKHSGVVDFEWIKNDAAGKPDFTIATVRIGIKTVKRSVAPKVGYTAQITAQHTEEPTDHYFFMTYEIAKKRMWLLGGIDKEKFLNLAKYYSAGEWVHPNYQVRPGHEIYNIEMEKLVRPDSWLKSVI
jgi:hypothetical protein